MLRWLLSFQVTLKKIYLRGSSKTRFKYFLKRNKKHKHRLKQNKNRHCVITNIALSPHRSYSVPFYFYRRNANWMRASKSRRRLHFPPPSPPLLVLSFYLSFPLSPLISHRPPPAPPVSFHALRHLLFLARRLNVRGVKLKKNKKQKHAALTYALQSGFIFMVQGSSQTCLLRSYSQTPTRMLLEMLVLIKCSPKHHSLQVHKLIDLDCVLIRFSEKLIILFRKHSKCSVCFHIFHCSSISNIDIMKYTWGMSHGCKIFGSFFLWKHRKYGYYYLHQHHDNNRWA